MKLIEKFRLLSLGLTILLSCPSLALADYTIVLKNGGQITVKAYWEEKGTVQFQGLGGRIGLAREQIQSIREARDAEARGLVLTAMESPPQAEASKEPLAVTGGSAGVAAVAYDRASDQRIEEALRSDKEKEYQAMHEALVVAIKSRTELLWLLTRGKIDPDPTLLETLEAINGRIADINARIKDIIHRPVRPVGTVRLLTNSPFSGLYGTAQLDPTGVVSPGFVEAQPFSAPTVGAAPPSYTAEERELSELRRQLEMLYAERRRLLETFKQEKLFTGSLPYEELP